MRAALCCLSWALVMPAAAQQGTPVSFEPNAGRWPDNVRFHARGGGLDAWVVDGGLVWSARAADGRACALRFDFAGAGQFDTCGEDEVCERRTYLRGARASVSERLWRSVRCRQIAAGVDLVLREGEGGLEYDLELAPGARLEDVVVRCTGAEGLFVAADGALVIETALGALRQPAPLAWQVEGGVARALEVEYRALDERSFGFEARGRDLALGATIDPALRWASYLSGSSDQVIVAVAAAPNGATVVAGTTQSVDFPITTGVWDDSFSGGIDSFVTCFSADGTHLLWSTFFGGSLDDELCAVACDALGGVIIAGATKSSDFPATAGAFDTSLGGAQDAFVARLAPDGSTLEWGTFIGGSSVERCGSLALAPSGDLVVVGTTRGSGFVTTAGAWDTSYNGGPFFGDVFVLSLAGDGASLRWSTYLGSAGDEVGEHVALAPGGEVALSGLAYSAQFPLSPLAWDALFQGFDEPFVARLSADGSTLLSSTFCGDANTQTIRGLTVAPNGATVCFGETTGRNFLGKVRGFDRHCSGASEGFVAELAADGRRLTRSTYFGGNRADAVVAAAFDAQGRLVIAGDTLSLDLATTPGAWSRTPLSAGTNLNYDLFVARLSSDLTQADYSSYLGGASQEHLAALALDAGGALLLAGRSAGPGFPTSPGAFQPTWNYTATHDGFAARFELLLHPIAYGAGKRNSQGSHGSIRWDGFPSVSEQTFRVGVDSAVAQAWACVFWGSANANLPYHASRLRVAAPFERTPHFKTDSFGYGAVTLPLDPLDVGRTLYFQVWYEDLGDPSGCALTDALEVVVYP